MNNHRRQITHMAAGLLTLALVLTFIPLTGGPTVAAAGTAVFINEIHYDNDGADTGEAIEIAGPAGTDMSGWSIALYNGSSSQLNVYDTITLSGVIPDQQDGFGTLSFSRAGIQNGSPDGMALVDSSSAVVQFLSYEGSFTAVSGPAAGMTSTDIGVEEGSSTSAGDSLQLTGTGSVYEDFTWATPAANTFGAVNTGQTFGGNGVPDVIINEVDADTPSYDTEEFIELYDGGTGNTVLDGLVVVLYNGSDDASYDAFDLDGFSTDADGYFVIGSVAEADLYVAPGSSGWLQNGADAVALYSGDAADFPNDTAATTDNLIDAIVYDTNDGDDAELLPLLNPGQPQVNEGGLGDKDNHSNQRCPNGEGGARNTDTYTQDTPTPDAANCQVPPPPIIINEVDADTPSYDAEEFIELYDSGTGNMMLDGLVVVLYNGNGDTSYNAFDLDGFSTDADGYFVIGSVAEADLYVAPGSSGWLQNGADAVALYSGEAADFPNGTAVTTDNLIDAIVYDTADSDDAGLLPLLNAGQPQIDEDGEGDKDNHSNQRCPNGEGGARNTDTYAQFPPTPGEENTCGVGDEFGQCGDPATFIHDVQGNGPTSPLVGASGVIVEGVVVGDFQDTATQLRGFFLQEEDTDIDTDPLTSEGIFVYDYGFMDVNVGDVVRVMGNVTEYYDLTELNYISNMAVCGSGSASAAMVTLPVSSLDIWEQYEGMLIHIPQTLYATDNYYQGRYGEVDLSIGDRLDNPTNVVLPGADAIALQDLNDRSRIQLEDGSTLENPPVAPYMGPDNTLRAGDTLPELTGVVNYGYGDYELHPTEAVNFTRVNTRDATPSDTGGVVKVASFNVLNYFSTIDDSGPICGPSGDMDCRGADTADEFVRQRTKIINAIVTMDADVIGLMEMENHPTDDALQDLVDGLNDAAGAGTYAFVNTGPVGTDAIKVAFIYKIGAVTPVGSPAILDSSVDPTFIDTKNRPALAQTFQHATDEVFTVVVNHLKSKGSACDDIGDPDMGDGQGNCNLTRTSAAIALVNWLATDPTGSGDEDFLIIGDLNAYAMEDPIAAIKAGGYTNMVESLIGADAYSYVFEGQSGYLDHALSSAGLTSRVTGVTEWHINADEPAALDYNDYNQAYLYNPDMYRASDHDPVIVGICDAVPPVVEVTVTPDTLWPPNHKYVTVEATVDVFDATGDTTLTLVSVTSNEPDNGSGDGNTTNDIVILDDFTFKLRAERCGHGDGRIYTITYQATDACGNSTLATATVTVPHSRGRGKK